MQLLSRLRSRVKGECLNLIETSPTGRGLSGVEVSAGSTEPKQTTSGDHNLALPVKDDAMDNVQHLRDLLCSRVPTELVDFHKNNHVITVHTHEPQRVSEEKAVILSVSLADPRLAALLCRVRRVELVIKGHDQGWSSFEEDHRTMRGAWTWYYSLGTSDPTTHEGRLATNKHAVFKTRKHTYVWERDSKVVRMLQEAKVIEVWAHARFSGWVNYVEDAKMSIYLG